MKSLRRKFLGWVGDNDHQWMLKPVCWWRGYHIPNHCDVHCERCTWCAKLLWSRRRDGSPNPYYVHGRPAPRAPIRRE